MVRWPAAAESWLEADNRRGFGAAAIVSLACLAAILLTTDIKTEGSVLYADPGWDRHVYRVMAERGLFDVRLAPYCWRILVPALAGWSPFSLQASFFAITVGALWGTGILVFATLRVREHPPLTALGGVLLFYSVGWAAKFIAADFWIPDGVALLLISLALWSALSRRPVVFACVLLAGAVTKESVLFAAPLYLTLNFQRKELWRQVVTTLLVAAPGFLALVSLRLFLDQRNGDAAYTATFPDTIRRFPELYGHYNYRTLFDAIAVEQRWRDRTWDDVTRYTLSPLGLALPALALVAIRRSWRHWLAFLPFFALVYSQLLFATDTQRLIVILVPALVVLGADGARALRLDSPAGGTLLMGLGVVSFLLILRDGLDYDPPLAWQAGVLAAFAVVAFVIRRRATPPASTGRSVGLARERSAAPTARRE